MSFLEWCESSALSAAIRKEAWTIPLIEIVHLAGVVLLFGSVLIANLRLLGRIFASEPASPLTTDLSRYTRTGLIALVLTGPLLFFAMPMKLFETPDFAIKLTLVAIAASYYLAVHRKRMRSPEAAGALRRSAAISLALWSIAILAGLELGAFS